MSKSDDGLKRVPRGTDVARPGAAGAKRSADIVRIDPSEEPGKAADNRGTPQRKR